VCIVEDVNDLCVNCTFDVMSAKIPFDPLLLPPSHMPVVYGPVKSRKARPEATQKDAGDDVDTGCVCAVCKCKLLVCLLVLQ